MPVFNIIFELLDLTTHKVEKQKFRQKADKNECENVSGRSKQLTASKKFNSFGRKITLTRNMPCNELDGEWCSLEGTLSLSDQQINTAHSVISEIIRLLAVSC